MSLKRYYDSAVEKLKFSGVPEPELDAWYLLEFVTGISRASFYADPDRSMSAAQKKKYQECIDMRKTRIPLQHITGVQHFMGLKFHVNGDVLIPRQDTEILVEEALAQMKAGFIPVDRGTLRILDLCTGSGCILLSVLYNAQRFLEVPVYGVGSDLSNKAIEVARGNASDLGIEACFTESDLFQNITGKYSIILSNPPYIRTGDIETLQPEVQFHDPRMALDGSEDGLCFYRRIISECGNYLLDGGVLMVEIGCDQAEDVLKIMYDRGFSDLTVKKDLAGLDRVVYGRYIRCDADSADKSRKTV